ncbi:TetR/AcrR family transcriptional regulator [Pseudomonas sp. CGJS7]|uniref:TetR/AcrR family transcriptional regulator n=1 Tax=Pseudomonas sp. CGJS7 TaxID=3109348 RepID=UPI00300A07C2
MPYTVEHKAQTRARIVDSARRLFNRHGFSEVSIDQIMAEAGLTRGGFYNHFQRKQDLYAEVVRHILSCAPGRGGAPNAPDARQLATDYLSDRHQAEMDYTCPLISFSSDVARGEECVKQTYTQVLDALIGALQRPLGDSAHARERALTMATLCVGGAMLARAIDDPELGKQIRQTALKQVLALADGEPAGTAEAASRGRA